MARRIRSIHLSPKESVILELLVRDDQTYGLQLVAASKRRLKRGTVYVTLGRMEEKGYITCGSRSPQRMPAAFRAGCMRPLRLAVAFWRRGHTLRNISFRSSPSEPSRRSSAAARIFSERTMARLVDPILTDLQVEYVDAMHRRGPWAGRRIVLVGYVRFRQALAMYASSQSLRVWSESTAGERLAITRHDRFLHSCDSHPNDSTGIRAPGADAFVVACDLCDLVAISPACDASTLRTDWIRTSDLAPTTRESSFTSHRNCSHGGAP